MTVPRFLPALLLFFAMVSTALADVHYTQVLREPRDQFPRQPATRVLAKPGLRLEESWEWHGRGYIKEMRLLQFAKKQTIVMDAMLKIYKVVPFGEQDDDKAALKVRRIGEETLFGYKAQHYQIDWYHPDWADKKFREDVWMVLPAQLPSYPADVLPSNSNLTGDLDQYEQVMSGLPLRIKITAPSKAKPDEYREVYTEEVTSLSRSPLEDSLFEIPIDYRQVSSEEFQRRQMDWMMKGMEE